MATDYRAAMEHFFEVLFDVHPRPDYRTPMATLKSERARCEALAGACGSHLDWVLLVRSGACAEVGGRPPRDDRGQGTYARTLGERSSVSVVLAHSAMSPDHDQRLVRTSVIFRRYGAPANS